MLVSAYPDVRAIVRILIQTAVRIQKGNVMFLQEINSSVAQRQMGKLFKMAYRKPTLLTRQCHDDVVVMSKSHYVKLIKAQQNRGG